MNIAIKAPAKINLHLEIRSKRKDGFHNLFSVFQAVSLYDEIHIRSLKTPDICQITGNIDFSASQNTLTRSIGIYRRKTGFTAGIAITIKKNIPQGAGLGGGSSDGAAVLKALNAQQPNPLTKGQLAGIASRVGSDVPFFLGEPTAVIKGRGDKIRPVTTRTDYRVVLIYPGFEINTGTAFSWWDKAGPHTGKKAETKRLMKNYLKNAPEQWAFFNSFEDLVKARYPKIGSALETLRKNGACFASLTGSGSTVFGIFPVTADIKKIAGACSEKYNAVFVARPLDRMLEPVIQ